MASGGWLRQISDDITERIAKFFVRLTYRVALRPGRTAIICLVAVLICASGWANFSDEDDPQKILVQQNSRALRDRDFIEDRFDDAPSPSQVFLNRRGDGANVLTRDGIRELFSLHDSIERIDSRQSNAGYDERTCAFVYWRALGDDPCQKESLLALWEYNRTKFEADLDFMRTINSAEDIHDCCSPNGRTVDITKVAAKIHRDEMTGQITGAGALRVAYYLEQDRHDKTRIDPVAYRLEKRFDSEVRRQNLPSFERLMPLTPAGVEGNVSSAFDFDRTIVTIAFVTISAYAYLALVKRRRKRKRNASNDKSSSASSIPSKSRGLLGLQAVGVVGLAVAAGYGICFAAGVEASPLVTVAAFLVLGVGVDDAFVIVGADKDDEVVWDRDVASILSGQSTIEAVAARRACLAMAVAGPSITTTSVTDAAAFLAGSWTRIPAIASFCSFAATCVVCDFLLQVTLFVALFVYDIRRKLRAHVKATERSVAPTGDDTEASPDGHLEDDDDDDKPRLPEASEHAAASDDDDDDDDDDEAVPGSSNSDDVEKPASSNSDDDAKDNDDDDEVDRAAVSEQVLEAPSDEASMERYVRAQTAAQGATTSKTQKSFFGGWYASALLSPPGLAFVFAATAATVAVASVGCARYEMDFDYNRFYVKGLFIDNDWIPRVDDFQRKWFPGMGAGEDSTASYGIYTKRGDYFAARDEMQQLLDTFRRQHYVVGNSLESNWFSAHERWLADQNDDENPETSEEYVDSVRTFLETDEGSAYATRVVIDGDTIAATQIDVFFEQDQSIRDSIDIMRDARREAKSAAPSLSPIVYGATFIWLEGLAIIETETVRALAVACSVVVVVLVLLLGDVAVAALVSGFVCCIALCTFGSIHWYGDELNFVSAFFIVISVGLATDASAHVAHAYIHAPSHLTTGPDRATYALDILGSSVFRGGLSTLVGVMIIGLAKTYVFQTFFWYLTTIMVLSLWFGLAVTPASLAVLGPYLVSTTAPSAQQEEPPRDLELAGGGGGHGPQEVEGSTAQTTADDADVDH